MKILAQDDIDWLNANKSKIAKIGIETNDFLLKRIGDNQIEGERKLLMQRCILVKMGEAAFKAQLKTGCWR